MNIFIRKYIPFQTLTLQVKKNLYLQWHRYNLHVYTKHETIIKDISIIKNAIKTKNLSIEAVFQKKVNNKIKNSKKTETIINGNTNYFE